MKKTILKSLGQFAFIAMAFLSFLVEAQTPKVRIDNTTPRQKITGFGGFVCSPQFAYDHMSPAEIEKMWGTNSEAGYNIMRLYIPTTKANWSAALATAQKAQSLGLIIFASPWSPPAEWKTNGNDAGTYNGVEGFLKEENYADFANYLNEFVVYLRNNGVELYAISLQNEPDYVVTYAGCSYTPAQITNFLKNYSDVITCRIIAPETVGMSNNYANALLATDVLPKFEIYAGHQYGGIGSTYKGFLNTDKEIWMTEFLINWNSNGGSRNFSWSTDAFDFAKSVNDVMVGGGNAWIHYATKRYYGMMGDGQFGTVAGEMTKRGYILSHFAKYTTGSRRLDAIWSDQGSMQGSAYINDSGDKVTLMVFNSSANTYNLKVDLPFYTTSAQKILTNETTNMVSSNLNFTETFRPTIQVNPSSFITFVFNKSNIREVSNMTGQDINYTKIESQTVTNPAFGTAYQLSGKTATLYNSTPLISSNMNDANGYVSLDDRYNKLVFHVNSYTTSNLPTSSNTTLYYVDNAGVVKSYNYGTVNLPSSGSSNFDLTFDISRAVLTTGCKGIIGLRNGNFSSVLTFNFGDVYFAISNEKAMKFAGVYSDGDSNLMDVYENTYYTSLDFTSVTAINTSANWKSKMANSNSIFYVNSGSGFINSKAANSNVVSGTVAASLELSDQGGDFNAPFAFTATAASYTKTLNGYAVIVLPFEANVPVGVQAYNMLPSSSKVLCTSVPNGKIPANKPVLINGNGTFTFTGSGSVSTPKAIVSNQFNADYSTVKAYTGGYVLKTVGGVTGFYKISNGSETVAAFSAYISEENAYSASLLPLEFETLAAQDISDSKLQLYPNPAKNEIFVNWKSSDAAYSIFDAKGSLISHQSKLVGGKNRIDISKFTSGVYFIEIYEAGKSIRTKFIKQ
ncbi:T9SS type A sorting domain-containing protein [Epilithonimonas pallida]|uniref:Glucuronoarabinoxylan endo-1,4-beta-xylanase n=1 Tax=Epilithonimonas pallida TaxID=373671 RepID=A0ABY1R1B5_9FLAO|nr:T9SS type A sorting domain-containing protein [Epilithonimonas pallida]SMP86944.1 glucuronoarabinoxylan endo-1,4-beta-xylanase [Epilithonimonas pallida]